MTMEHYAPLSPDYDEDINRFPVGVGGGVFGVRAERARRSSVVMTPLMATLKNDLKAEQTPQSRASVGADDPTIELCGSLIKLGLQLGESALG